jgi:protein-L-isoaspartate(D-aspartate) O-methyltransferase
LIENPERFTPPERSPVEKESLKYQRLREEMVRQQIEARGVGDPAVLEALRKVPRHIFVSEALRDQAYGDFPLPIGEQQTISQPYIVAEMTQALQLTREDRVLEIGTGSGYQAAILAEIAYRVYTIERIRALYLHVRRLFDELRLFNVVTRYGDGSKGWEEESPFDAIIITAGAPKIPAILVNQLAVGGRLVAPIGNPHSQELIKLVKDKTGIRQSNLGGCRFVKLVGEHGWQEP